MGYYSDTTKRLLDQIGKPYEYTASQGLDLSSLLMALMFMPRMGSATTPRPKSPTALQWSSMPPNTGPVPINMIPPEIFSAILGLPGIGGII